ncbi:MAG: Ni/Fe-hydrogenase, b-type cytochrome subunit [Helicobacter sp.]|nr:Ni/Fe-hydrogenase, b-type cytochrome subunit [Helicobacter sp.]
MESNKTFTRHVEFSPLTRILHWVRALCIFALIITGFYLGYPFLTSEPGMQLYALARGWHVIIGFVLIGATLFRFYLFFFSRGSAEERKSLPDSFSASKWIAILKTYLLLGTHPKQNGAYNPLQLVTYTFLMILIVLMSVTGIVLYMHTYHEGLGGALEPVFKSVEVMFGGLAQVRFIHHCTTWAFVVFIPVHIYMATWNAVRYPGGGLDTIASGYRYEKQEG